MKRVLIFSAFFALASFADTIKDESEHFHDNQEALSLINTSLESFDVEQLYHQFKTCTVSLISEIEKIYDTLEAKPFNTYRTERAKKILLFCYRANTQAEYWWQKDNQKQATIFLHDLIEYISFELSCNGLDGVAMLEYDVLYRDLYRSVTPKELEESLHVFQETFVLIKNHFERYLTISFSYQMAHACKQNISRIASFLTIPASSIVTIALGSWFSQKLIEYGSKRPFQEYRSTIGFENVIGVDGAKEELQDIVHFLKKPEDFARLGARVPTGVLLVGEPGNGKTLLARAIAGEAGCNFFYVSGSEFVELYVGQGPARVRELFSQAKEQGPTIIFIDEIDALGRSRNSMTSVGNAEFQNTVNQLLVELDKVNETQNVVVIAATNHPGALDKALLRPGRFDKHIQVEPPYFHDRVAMLRLHAKKMKVDDIINFEQLGKMTIGFSGADCFNLSNQAALLATKEGTQQVLERHYLEAYDILVLGKPNKNIKKLSTPEDRELTARHEAGHALMKLHEDLKNYPGKPTQLDRVTILPRGQALGVTFSTQTEQVSKSRQELKSEIQVALAGRIAELLYAGEQGVTGGARSDLIKAYRIARMMVDAGMSHRGPLYWDEYDKNSEHLKALREQEAQTIIDECDKEVRTFLNNHTRALDEVSSKLLEKETISGTEVQALFEQSLNS